MGGHCFSLNYRKYLKTEPHGEGFSTLTPQTGFLFHIHTQTWFLSGSTWDVADGQQDQGVSLDQRRTVTGSIALAQRRADAVAALALTLSLASPSRQSP